MYQATIYDYNQRAEVLIPERRGTTYYGPDNHKPLIAYRGLNVEFEFFGTMCILHKMLRREYPTITSSNTFVATTKTQKFLKFCCFFQDLVC